MTSFRQKLERISDAALDNLSRGFIGAIDALNGANIEMTDSEDIEVAIDLVRDLRDDTLAEGRHRIARALTRDAVKEGMVGDGDIAAEAETESVEPPATKELGAVDLPENSDAAHV